MKVYKLISICVLPLIFFTFLFFPSCNNNPITAEEDTPGRRDYIWSVDSVNYEDLPGRIELYSIWGSSPNDVWGAGFTEDVRNCLWHYDGKKWSRAVWNTPITQYGNGSKSVGGVWGTSKEDVWAFGGRIYSSTETTGPFIMHYDGNEWTEVTGDESQMPDGYRDIYAIRKDNFWISSSEYVSEFKDGTWKKYFIGENYIIQSIEGIGNNVYLTAYPIGIDSLYLMKLNGNKFVVIDKSKLFGEGKFEHNGLLFADSKGYTFGSGVSVSGLSGDEIISDSWKNVISLADGQGFRNGYRNSSKDIWGIGYPSIVYQYNGEDWQRIFIDNKNTDAGFTGIWGDGNEIFICDIENGIVYHGK